MKRATKIVLTVGTAISLGLAAAAVSAQPFGYGMGSGGGHMGGYGPGYGMGRGMTGGNGAGPGYNMGPGMMGDYGPGYGMGPQAMFNGYGNADEGLAALKSELGITAKQDPAWQAFASNAKRQNESRQAWFAKMQEARSTGSAPEQQAQQLEFMKQRQTEMAANAAALKNLYATLTPEQKAIADQRFGGTGPGWTQGYRGGPRGYAR
ncbi:MAG: Spy/CpxP family protein refolding chaperone [Burkholderiales bacterium]|nr:Spy/CpxP family protein refolding chaperone [Burkholderiales bacterium]